MYLIITFRPQVMLGVTNPFFAKALEHWPHIIRLADITNSSEDAYASPSAGSGRSRSPGDGTDSKPGIQTKYKPFLNKDKTFAKVISTSKVSGMLLERAVEGGGGGGGREREREREREGEREMILLS